MVILETVGLKGGYNGENVLKGIDLRLESGGFLGVIGPNGCGKSTLVKAISGVLPRVYGDVRLKDELISDMSRKEIAKVVAVVPQKAYISFPFSVEEVVSMGRTPHLGRFESVVGEHAVKVEGSLEAVGLSEMADRNVRDLSGGEFQRVLLARALAQEPELILLDEATSHLDIGHKLDVLGLVSRLNKKEGLAVITVHHNLNLAARFCNEVMLMDQGEIHAIGRPEEVITPNHLRAVYGVEAEVNKDVRNGSLYVVPLIKGDHKTPKNKVVHVVGGGGSAEEMMKELIEEGYEVTTGVLNAMDSDLKAARFMSIEAVIESPFSEISPLKMKENISKMKEADVIVVAPFPIGPGNLRNLKSVEVCAKEGSRVILIKDGDVGARDYTEGEAVAIWGMLKNIDNVKICDEPSDLNELLEKIL